MEFYARLNVYEELELVPCPAGLIHASVWKLPTSPIVVVLASKNHKKMAQEGVESVQIRIKRGLNKKIREDGSIWLNENEYDLINVKTVQPKIPKTVEAPTSLVAVSDEENAKRPWGLYRDICVKCGRVNKRLHYHDTYEVCFDCWMTLDAEGMEKYNDLAEQKNREILKQIHPAVFK